MKRQLLLMAFFTSLCATAQVKIGDNPTNVNSNAVFELESTNKGLLFPRMALSSTASPSPLSAFVAGMTVYNTTVAGTGTTAVSPGLYYSDGTKWVALGKDWAEDQSLGSIAIFPFSSIPSTYLECNGAAISRTTYAALFAKIGTTYGAGNGSTTFNLPDLRGEFVRGWDNGRGVDTGRVLGSAQAQATARPTTGFTGVTSTNGNHSHTVTTNDNGGVNDNTVSQSASQNPNSTVQTSGAGDHSHTVSINGGGDSETRPRNVAMVYAIKAVESIIVGSGSGSGSGTTYSGSQSVTLNGTTFERAALTGDVTAASNSNATTIAANAVTSAKIADATVANADLATGTGGIYKGSGSLSGATTVTMGTNTLAFPSTATTGTSHFTVDGTTLNVDAVNNRLGIGTATPGARLEISSGTAGTSGLRFSNINSSTPITSTGVSTLGVNASGDVVVVNGVSTYESGDVVQVKVYSGSEISGTYNSALINGTFSIPSFTPKSSNSIILIEADGTYYVSGSGIDHFSLQVRLGTTLLMDKRQVWNSSNAGSGTRSSVLLPVIARYNNTSTAAKSFNLTLNRISGDDDVTFSNNIVVKITEIQN